MVAGNFSCPRGEICSGQFGTLIDNQNYYFRTSTAIQQASGGTQITGGITTLYYWKPKSGTGIFGFGEEGNWQPAARTTDGKSWSLLKDSQENNVLGTDAANSLLNPTGNLNKNVAARARETIQTKGGLTQQQAQTVIKTNAGISTSTEAPPNASDSSSPDSGSAITPEGNPTTLADIQSNSKASETKNRIEKGTYGDTHYPLNRNPSQDYIKFTMLRYSPRSIEFGSFSGNKPTSSDIYGNRLKDRVMLGTVTLPIQPSISDTNLVRWGESPMNAFQSAAAATSLNIITEGEEGAERSVASAGQILQQGAGEIKSFIASTAAQMAAGGGENANFFTRLTGGIINPNLELLFEGPQLRGFTFNFTMSAREPKEAQAIKKIIRFFKQGMSVKRSETSLFLQSPNTFNIQYIYGGDGKGNDHRWINKIKECALQNCSVNYTPAGNYATYLDGSMTQYDLTLTFSELDPIYDDDYKEADTAVGGGLDSSIGY